MKRSMILETIMVLYVILFLYTGISKSLDYDIFKEQLSASPLLLAPIAKPVALLLPWTEFLVVLLPLVPRWRLKGFYYSLLLMLSFTVYILVLLTFSKNLLYSCGGIIELLSREQHVVFNTVFIVLGFIALVLEKNKRKIQQKERNEMDYSHNRMEPQTI